MTNPPDHKKPQGAPREFWASPEGSLQIYLEPKFNIQTEAHKIRLQRGWFRLIEHSAYLDLQRQLDKVQEDATFCRENYDSSVKLSESLSSKLTSSESKRLRLREALKEIEQAVPFTTVTDMRDTATEALAADDREA